MSGEHFIDLRLNRGSQDHNESFWPSFTDIMMVILMVFLLAMVTLLIRNSELLRQLGATLEAERAASILAQQVGAEKDALSQQLIEAREQMSALQSLIEQLNLRNTQTEAQVAALEKTVADQEQAAAILQTDMQNLASDLASRDDSIRSLTGERDSALEKIALTEDELAKLQHMLEQERLALANEQGLHLQTQEAQVRLEEETRTLTSQIAELNATLSAVREELQSAGLTLDEKTQRITELQQQLTERSSELENIRQQMVIADQRYTTLTDEFTELKTEYDLLFKPARSSEGKLAARAVYRGSDTFALTTPDGKTQTLSTNATEATLKSLMQQHCDLLYVQVVFPDAVNISHSRAWQLTSRLHQYDYYYREGACE